eukprot:CAMPEP_0206478338 /NCGR_PEP_ID=MMETSP0324_2-20121206/35967_1 /ASSEMBLY_ACC=CAM_ASM_000836 /TAXON_ID=2866 /ORGANISM="Crypthecodinium cohnii, Strain Seligo" /LENGTH=43 /DNA_ID= /DNA_START= /DNA_END= /DNA_ORIENTATION=
MTIEKKKAGGGGDPGHAVGQTDERHPCRRTGAELDGDQEPREG